MGDELLSPKTGFNQNVPTMRLENFINPPTIQEQIDDIKKTIADIYTHIPLEKGSLKTTIVTDMLATGITALDTIPGLQLAGTTVRLGAEAYNLISKQINGTPDFKKKLLKFYNLLKILTHKGAGTTHSLTREAYDIVTRFLDKYKLEQTNFKNHPFTGAYSLEDIHSFSETPDINDIIKFKSDIVLTPEDLSHFKQEILFTASIFRPYELFVRGELISKKNTSGGVRELRKTRKRKLNRN